MRVALLASLIPCLALSHCGGKKSPPPPAAAETTAPVAKTEAPTKPAAPATKPVAAPPAKPASDPVDKELTPDEMKEMERRPGLTPAPADRLVKSAHTASELAGKPGPSPAIGPDDALVKVIVFSDFQCPVCRRSAEPVKHLAAEFGDDVQVIFKHNALTSHQRAEPAARAAIAAQRQGKFWAFHDKAFQNSRNLSDPDLAMYAEELGLDVAKFNRDLADPAVAEQVAYERALAEALGARGTPAFFINGKRTVGWGSYFGLRASVKRALKASKELVAGGLSRTDAAKRATAEAGPEGQRLVELLWGK